MKGTSASSSRPISSKLEISVNRPSGPENWEDDWKEEDLEDLDPDNSGGELGVQTTAMSTRAGTEYHAVLDNEGIGELATATGRERPNDSSWEVRSSGPGSTTNVPEMRG